MEFGSPIAGAVAGTLAACAAFVLLARRDDARKISRWLLVAAMALLAVAVADVRLRVPRPSDVVVMVDLSPSTRGAGFRDRDALIRRAGELLNGRSFRVVTFADRSFEEASPRFAEIPARRTLFSPPRCDAVLLFSDGQFDVRSSDVPVFAVIDEALTTLTDARVHASSVSGRSISVIVDNGGGARTLRVSGVSNPAPIEVAPDRRLEHRFIAKENTVSAQLSPGDRWPENDAITLAIDPERYQQWWVSDRPAPAGWTALTPDRLPNDLSAFLSASALVLDNIHIDRLSIQSLQRIEEYVRKLGGSLVINGGDSAFASGAYAGSRLEAMSPLASTPPRVEAHWVILIDASGSMAADDRLSRAMAAARSALTSFPDEDLVSIATFSRDVQWLFRGSTVQSARQVEFPPGIQAAGPTDAEPAIESALSLATASTPLHLLVLSDAQAELTRPATLVRRAADVQARVHLLGLAPQSRNSALAELCLATGGNVIAEEDATRWSARLLELTRPLLPRRFDDRTIRVTFLPPYSIGEREFQGVNETFMKEGAAAIAVETGAGRQPQIATWQVGAGTVSASSVRLSERELSALTELLGRPPRDPRFAVSIDTRAERIVLDALDEATPINELRVAVLFDDGRELTLTQTAPGRYEAPFEFSAMSQLVSIRVNGALVARHLLEGRYPHEFENIGINREALDALARTSGGRLILPDETSPIRLDSPTRSIFLSVPLTLAAVLCIVGALICWRLDR